MSSSCDISMNNSELYPAFSSLEVELSMVAENFSVSEDPNESKMNSSYTNDDLMKPRRASEVFGFLTAKKSQTRRRPPKPSEGRASALAGTFQTPVSCFSSYSSSAGSHESDIPYSIDTHMKTVVEQDVVESSVQSCYNQATPKWPSESNWLEPPQSRMINHYIATGTSRNSLEDSITFPPEIRHDHTLRGPRLLPSLRSNSTRPTAFAKEYQSHNNFTLPHAKSDITASDPDISIMDHNNVVTSIPSCCTLLAHTSNKHRKPDLTFVTPNIMKPIQPKNEWSPEEAKENESGGPCLYKTQFLPMTPVRSRYVFRAPQGATPSPASSSDLSPAAQQLMADLRTQRINARERQKRKWGSTTSKLKW